MSKALNYVQRVLVYYYFYLPSLFDLCLMNYITTIPSPDKTKYYNSRKGVDSLTVKDKYFYLRKRVNLLLMKKMQIREFYLINYYKNMNYLNILIV